MPYPDKLLADDEEVVRHLHPHWLTLFWPVGPVPGHRRCRLVRHGRDPGRAAAGRRPDGRSSPSPWCSCSSSSWCPCCAGGPPTTWSPPTGCCSARASLSRHGRDIGLSRITDVSYRQSLWDRIINSGTLTIESAGESGTTVLRQIPDSEGVQQLLNHMVEEDADRRAQESAGYVGEYYGDRATPRPRPPAVRSDPRWRLRDRSVTARPIRFCR